MAGHFLCLRRKKNILQKLFRQLSPPSMRSLQSTPPLELSRQLMPPSTRPRRSYSRRRHRCCFFPFLHSSPPASVLPLHRNSERDCRGFSARERTTHRSSIEEGKTPTSWETRLDRVDGGRRGVARQGSSCSLSRRF